MNDKQSEPRPIGSHPKVYNICKQMLEKSKAKKILDCPTGEGPLARLLIEDNFDVTCCDIRPEIFKLTNIQCDYGDLNEYLNYEDHQFDAVTCLNGLQRVWARGRAVRELSRVVKPGGHLIISIPNHGDLRRRLLYLLTASQSWTVVGPPQVCMPDAENPAEVFRYGLTLANVISALESVGCEIVEITATHYSISNILLSPMVPVLKLSTILIPKKWFDLFFLKEVSTLDSFLGAYLVIKAKES